MKKVIPVINSFDDLVKYHADGKPILYCQKSISPSFDLLVRMDYMYNFPSLEVKEEVNEELRKRMYMFEAEETHMFYWPNDNMFSMSNAEYNIRGWILTLKDEYK